jgi:type 1 glutamine amidotransferase
MTKRALIVWGGWAGHKPKECADLFAPWLKSQGYEVEVSDTLDSYLDTEKLSELSLIVPIWTMGQITKEQEKGLLDAVAAGVGIAGFHGGMCDAFRNNTQYQWMTGGQWVAHPGDIYPAYDVKITHRDHPIMQGVSDFTLTNTERYYLHTDPSNNVLATITFEESGVVMPYVWTRSWGKGKVFYAAWGHTDKDFGNPMALLVVQRGMLWASR